MAYKDLEQIIIDSYESGITLDEAEKLAGRFLAAQIEVSRELQVADLNSRMRKSGVKAIRAAVYTSTIQQADKRPTEAALDHTLNMDELVLTEQKEFDTTEANKAELERMYSIFQNAHLHFRAIAKGRFE